MLRLYELIDSERHWIAAHDVAEALGVYLRTYDDEEAPAILEVPREQWTSITIRDDDRPGGKTTAEVLILELGDAAGLIASTVC